MRTLQVTLKHLLIEDQKQIGILHYPNKVIEALLKELPGLTWSAEFSMHYVVNKRENFNKIMRLFKGVAWVNCHHFFPNKPINVKGERTLRIDRKKHLGKEIQVPEGFLRKLEIKRYSSNTAKSYISCFAGFMRHYRGQELLTLGEEEIRAYIRQLISKGLSNSSVNLNINAIKFYYEVVLGMPNRFYDVERPIREKKLPDVFSKEEILKMIDVTRNNKHKCIIGTLYSAGIRRS